MISKQHEFKSWLEKKGILGFLFDLDDTLIKTNEVFDQKVEAVVSLYAQAMPHIPKEEIGKLFYDTNVEMHQIYAVNPVRWDHVVPAFESKIGIETSIEQEVLAILSTIYKRKIEFEEGTQEFLFILKDWGFKLGLVTHANVEWTLTKLEALGLNDFFDWVEIVDENKLHKDVEDWKIAAQKIHLLTSQLIGVGDNVKGDVQPAVNAGFGEVVWVDKKNGWQHYREGQLPSGVHVVQRVIDIQLLGRQK